MRRSKRGVMDDSMFWIFKIILIMFLVFAVVIFISSIIAKNLDTQKLELHLLAARIINSPDCLAKTSQIMDTERVYPGVIDLSKYDEQHLKNDCIIDEGEPGVGVNITISGMPSKYINQEYYQDIEPLTFSSRYLKVTKVLPVLIDSNGKSETKTIEINLVAKKR